MGPSLLMVAASLLFAVMGVCVKQVSAAHGAGEIVLARSVIGLVLMLVTLRWRGLPWRTPVPLLHANRSVIGTIALCLWFYSMGGLPLGTAITLNYLSSVWMALFLVGGAVLLGGGRQALDARLLATVLTGFLGVALVLRPTIERDQLWHGLIGLLSGMGSAVAYLQISALGRAGEPGERVVLYFSLAGIVAGGVLAAFQGGLHRPDATGFLLLLAIGVLATAGQWLMTLAYASGATLTLASLQYLGILFGCVFGVWLFDDPLTLSAGVGMVLIVGAGIAANALRERATGHAEPAPD